MALKTDSLGFIIGEKRFKELNGNLSNIDDTTQEILALLRNNAEKSKKKRQVHTRNIQALQNEQGIHNKHASQIGQTLQKAIKTDVTANHIAVTPYRTKAQSKPFNKPKEAKEKATRLQVTRQKDTAQTSDEHLLHTSQENTKQDINLSLVDKIIDEIETPSVENISPELDAIREIDGIIRPASKAFVALGKGAKWLFTRPRKKDVFIPMEQSKQHKLDNKHDREEIRLYRLILMKLKQGQFWGLLGGLANLLKGLGGIDIDRKKRKGGAVVAGKKNNQKDNNKKTNQNQAKTNKHTGNIPKAGKVGIVASALALVGLGALLNADEKPKDATEQPTKPPSNSLSTTAKVGAGALAGGAIAMTINPLLAPVGLALGGLGGIIADKLTPYFGRTATNIDEQQQVLAQDTSNQIRQQQTKNQIKHDTTLAQIDELSALSDSDKLDKENQLNTGYSNRNIVAEQHAKQTDSLIQSLFKNATSIFDTGVQWVSKTLSSLGEMAKSFLSTIVVAVTGGSESVGGGVSGNPTIAIMGKYNIVNGVNKSDTGAGDGDHFHIEWWEDPDNKKRGVNNEEIFKWLAIDGKSLQQMRDDKTYVMSDGQKYGAVRWRKDKNGNRVKGSHQGWDLGKSVVGKEGARLTLADGYTLINLEGKKGHDGYGNSTIATIREDATGRIGKALIGHQNATGVDEVLSEWNAKKNGTTAVSSSTGGASSGNYAAIDYNRGLGSRAKQIQQRQQKDQYGVYQKAGKTKHYRYAEAARSDLVNLSGRKVAGRNIWRGTNSASSSIHKEALPYLEAMFAAAAKDGVDLSVMSAFRSIENTRLDGKADRAGAGGSEHHTGFAVDFTALFNKDEDKLTAQERKILKWLDTYAAQYGFVRSFTKNNKMGVFNEVWHWKFVGTDYAIKALTPQGGQGALLPDGRVITRGTLNGKSQNQTENQTKNQKPKTKAKADALPKEIPTTPYALPSTSEPTMIASVREPIYPSKPSKAVQMLTDTPVGDDRLPVHLVVNTNTLA